MRFNTRWIAKLLAVLALVTTVTGTDLLRRAEAADEAVQAESDAAPAQGEISDSDNSSDAMTQQDAVQPDKDQ